MMDPLDARIKYWHPNVSQQQDGRVVVKVRPMVSYSYPQPSNSAYRADLDFKNWLKLVKMRWDVMKDALELVAGEHCTNFTGDSNCKSAGKIRGAPYTADSWCDACIAREALDYTLR